MTQTQTQPQTQIIIEYPTQLCELCHNGDMNTSIYPLVLLACPTSASCIISPASVGKGFNCPGPTGCKRRSPFSSGAFDFENGDSTLPLVLHVAILNQLCVKVLQKFASVLQASCSGHPTVYMLFLFNQTAWALPF